MRVFFISLQISAVHAIQPHQTHQNQHQQAQTATQISGTGSAGPGRGAGVSNMFCYHCPPAPMPTAQRLAFLDHPFAATQPCKCFLQLRKVNFDFISLSYFKWKFLLKRAWILYPQAGCHFSNSINFQDLKGRFIFYFLLYEHTYRSSWILGRRVAFFLWHHKGEK